LLRADEEDRLAAGGERTDEVHRLLQQGDGLLEVDDVDAVALGVDERLHPRVPAVGLVSEVDAGLEEGLHGDGGLLLGGCGGGRGHAKLLMPPDIDLGPAGPRSGRACSRNWRRMIADGEAETPL